MADDAQVKDIVDQLSQSERRQVALAAEAMAAGNQLRAQVADRRHGELDPSLDYDVAAMLEMTPKEQARHVEEIRRRRQQAHDDEGDW